jgi:DNA polymerase III subunit epsilon
MAEPNSRFIALDTETNGFPLWNQPSDDPHQPHIVQLSCILCEPDGRELSAYDRIIRPDGWTIPQDTVDVHGITMQQAMVQGIPEKMAMREFWSLAREAKLVVAHGHSFDARIIRIALKRFATEQHADWWQRAPGFCTMRRAAKVCGLTQKGGRAKNPTLREAVEIILKEPFAGTAHDALYDVIACKRLYLALRGMEEVA